MTNELKTYTIQELYKQPLEPVEYLVDGLLTPGAVHTGRFTQGRQELDGAAAVPRCVRRKGLSGAENEAV